MSGTNGQMVGNLESGDYTIVGFTITQNMQKTPGNFQRNSTTNTQPSVNNTLKVQIDYTDGIGERRTSILELPLAITSFSTNSTTSFPSKFGARTQNSSVFSKWYFWVIIVVLLLLAYGFYNKYKKRIKNFFNKSKQKPNEDSSEPDWIKKAKGKKIKIIHPISYAKK